MNTPTRPAPRGIVVAGLRGGSGKSIIAVGLAAAFARNGQVVAPFKKGPDYIDAGWLGLAANRSCYNLDPYLMTPEQIRASVAEHGYGADLIVIEGNRGLYDGVNVAGAYSTAELAVALDLPVLLVVDCTKSTRTVAALVLGCREMDRRLKICGVVLNQLGSSRQEKVIRQAVTEYTGIPVVGALRRQKDDIFPQRHLGVTPYQEHGGAREAIDRLAGMIADSVDLAALAENMTEGVTVKKKVQEVEVHRDPVRIGVLKDAAFQFYYPDNLEALAREGAEIVEINAMTAGELPAVDGLYIGGGFPETSAAALAANGSFLASLRERIDAGLPVYAECGGLIYLGQSIELHGESYNLAGIFPVRFTISERPQAHGYTVLRVDGANPFYPQGLELKGHEFRYSSVEEWAGTQEDLALVMERGVGFARNRDGLVFRNVLALYTHVHSLGTPEWAPAVAGKAREWRAMRKKK